MKRILGIFMAILFMFISIKGAQAQILQGKRFEFSTSASLWNIKYEWSDEAYTLINIPIRIGYFIFKRLEIEPELFLTIPEDGDDTGVIFFGNVSYNFKASKKAFPFILGGAGFGNALQTYTQAWDYGENTMAFNLGAGLKYLVGNSAGIRIEYRLTTYSAKGEHLRTDNNIFIGLSIFF